MGGVTEEPGDPNPFESPQTEPVLRPAGQAPLAERQARALAVSIDGLFYLLAVVPGLFAFARPEEEDSLVLFGGLAGLAVFGLVVYQTYLVSTTGQSIGKRIMGIKIVRLDRSPVGFVHGILLRSWVMGMATGIPMIGGLISLADVLLIFAEDRRCLHDHLAGTIVIEAGPVTERSGGGDIPTDPWAR